MTIPSERIQSGGFDLVAKNGAAPLFLHRATGLEFRYIAPGTFQMGLPEDELQAAARLSDNFQADVDEMRPVRLMAVSALLVATTPVLNRHLEGRRSAQHQDRSAYLGRDDAESFAARHKLRLVKEHEWEYCCRAGSATLFAFGDTLPSDLELSQWLSSDFSEGTRPRSNSFGLSGLFEPQWCDDLFKINLREDAPLLDGSHAIRGGGAYFWPWQDEEWVWCMSAMRSPASGLEDGKACVRLVFDI
jgi:formylglycine-generating enzyme required for sulfatase activity